MTYIEPLDDADIPVSSGYVPNTGFIPTQSSSNISTDSGGKQSAPVNINLKQIGDVLFALGQALKVASIPVTLASDQGAIATLDTNSASNNTHLGNIDTATSDLVADLDSLIANTTGLATQATLSAAKSDLDTLAGIVSSNKAAVKAGAGDFTDLATLAGIVSGGKGAVKAATNDIVDLATLLALAGAAGDANTASTFMGRLTKIRDLLNGTLGIQQTDLSISGTINAAQPVIGTTVAGATVQLAVGQGQSTWKAQLVNGGGGFTSGTTLVADGSPDGGTTWYSKSFKVSGASPATGQSSVVGPGPLELSGNASGLTHVRIRCSVLNSTETIAVTLRGSAGIGDVGLLSSIPAGSNEIGAMLLRAATGVALAADQSNTELRISNYVTKTTAGDTALALGQTTKVNSLPVTFASDQAEPVNVGTPTGSVVSVGTGSTAVVTPGANAKFLLLTNDSPNTIYLNISGGAAALNAGVRLNANGGAILFDRYIPSAAITAISSVANSNLLVEVG